ncbi:MAG: hypothetical protein V3R21_07540, partial [Woeseiaceae bacterium]
VNLRAAERARHARRALACKRWESEALQGRAGVAYTSSSPFFEYNAVDAGTTPGREDDCRDAGRLQGCRTTTGMQDDCRDAGARATQERLPG